MLKKLKLFFPLFLIILFSSILFFALNKNELLGARTEGFWQLSSYNVLSTTGGGDYDVLISGENKHINFGWDYGDSGYGFKDNNGIMQYKNSGGSWADIGSGGGGGATSSSIYITVCDSDCDYTTDGTADDIQIQQALDNASTTGGIILVKAGTYDISSQIKIYSNEILKGEGDATVLKLGSGLSATSLFVNDDTTNGNENIAIKDLMFDGNHSGNNSDVAIKIVEFNNVEGLRIENTTVIDHYYTTTSGSKKSFEVWNSKYITIKGNHFYNASDGIIIRNSDIGSIVGNVGEKMYSRFIEVSNDWVNPTGTYSENFVISDNSVKTVYALDSTNGDAYYVKGQNVIVSNNIAEDVYRYGIRVVPSDTNYHQNYNKIVNNTIIMNATSSDGEAGIILYGQDNSQVIGNTVINSVDDGIDCERSDKVIVNDNFVKGAKLNGIHIHNATSSDVQINNNTILNTGSNDSTYGAIALETVEGAHISNNVISYDDNQTYYGIRVWNVSDYEIVNNEIESINDEIAVISGDNPKIVKNDNEEKYNDDYSLYTGGSERLTVSAASGLLEVNNNLQVDGSAHFSEYLYHEGDTNTYLRFVYDRLFLTVGGVNMLDLYENGPLNYLKIGSGSYTTNISFNGDAMRLDGATGYLGLGTTTPAYKLDVYGNARIDGELISDMFSIYDMATTTALNLYTNGDFDGTNGLIKLHIDNSSSAGTGIYLRNDGSGIGLNMTQVGNGDGQRITNYGTQNGLLIKQYDTLNTDRHLLSLYNNSSYAQSSSLLQVEDASSDSTYPTVDIVSATTSSLYLYSTDALPGRIILEDTDGAGCTEITTLNGTINGKIIPCP